MVVVTDVRNQKKRLSVNHPLDQVCRNVIDVNAIALLPTKPIKSRTAPLFVPLFCDPLVSSVDPPKKRVFRNKTSEVLPMGPTPQRSNRLSKNCNIIIGTNNCLNYISGQFITNPDTNGRHNIKNNPVTIECKKLWLSNDPLITN